MEEPKGLKMLLVGPSDSGKTTFLKQLKIFYGGGFVKAEITKEIIYQSLFRGIQALIENCDSEEYRTEFKDLMDFAKIVKNSIPQKIKDLVENLVENPDTDMLISKLMESTFDITDSTK
jgi:ABC-type multidrug transport system ATPase subunit